MGLNEEQDYQARLENLSKSQRTSTESFVARKMEGSRSRDVIKWGVGDVAVRLAEILCN